MKLPVAPESIKVEGAWQDSESFNNTFNLRNWCGEEVLELTGEAVVLAGCLPLSSCLRGLGGQTGQWTKR